MCDFNEHNIYKILNDVKYWKKVAEYLSREIGKADIGGICAFIGKPPQKCTGCGECVLYYAEQQVKKTLS